MTESYYERYVKCEFNKRMCNILARRKNRESIAMQAVIGFSGVVTTAIAMYLPHSHWLLFAVPLVGSLVTGLFFLLRPDLSIARYEYTAKLYQAMAIDLEYAFKHPDQLNETQSALLDKSYCQLVVDHQEADPSKRLCSKVYNDVLRSLGFTGEEFERQAAPVPSLFSFGWL
jgi:hypothetical protein